MFDGALKLTLSDYTAFKLMEKAKALGVPPEELAAMVLDQQFFDYDDFSWPDGDLRTNHGSKYGLNEPGRPWIE